MRSDHRNSTRWGAHPIHQVSGIGIVKNSFLIALTNDIGHGIAEVDQGVQGMQARGGGQVLEGNRAYVTLISNRVVCPASEPIHRVH